MVFTYAPTPTPAPIVYQQAPYYPTPSYPYNYGYNNQYAQPVQYYQAPNYPTPYYQQNTVVQNQPQYYQAQNYPILNSLVQNQQPSGVKGTVTIGPVCRNLNNAGNCYVPYQAQISFYTAQGAYAGSTTADNSGNFSINLPVGGYTMIPYIYNPTQKAPQQIITVANSGYSSTAIIYDSGIRY